jgi:hypothetical protein
MAARRRVKAAPIAPPETATTCHRPHVDADLLRAARVKAYLLLLATDGLLHGAGTYTHEEFTEEEPLSLLAHDLAQDLAKLGRQADGPAVERLAAVEAKKGAM